MILNVENQTVPVHQISDYVEIAYLGACLMIGGPVNLVAFAHLAEQRRPHHRSISRLMTLKQHLNVSNLLLLLIYVTSKLCWLMTYDWRGGPILCPAIQTAQSLSFMISSNVIVCVALDRFLTVFFPRFYTESASKRGVKVLLGFGWIVALIGSLPPLWIWRLVVLHYPLEHRHFAQCTTIWVIRRSVEQHDLLFSEEMVYNAALTILMFFVPFTVVLGAYTMIIGWMCVHTMRLGKLEVTYVEGAQQPHERSSMNESSGDAVVDFHFVSPQATGRSSSSVSNALNRATRQMLIMTLVLVGVYVLCWAPYNVLALWVFVDLTTFNDQSKRFYFFYSFCCLNAVINPFIYGAVKCPGRRCKPSWLS